MEELAERPVVTIKAGRGFCFDVDGLVLRATRRDGDQVLVEADKPGLYIGWHEADDLHWPGDA